MNTHGGSKPGADEVDRELSRALDALGAAERASARGDLEASVADASVGVLGGSGGRGVVRPRGALRAWGGVWRGVGLAACLALVVSVAWMLTTGDEGAPSGASVASSTAGNGDSFNDFMLLTAFENYDDSFTLRFETLRAEAVAVRAHGRSGDVDDVLMRIEGGW